MMTKNNKHQILVAWIIWASLVTGIVIYQFALGGGVPSGANAPSSGVGVAVVLGIAQVVVASFIRWFFIPKAKAPGQMLVCMIIGLALSEAVEFYGLFLVPTDQPSTKLSLWFLSLLSAAQFIPTYVKAEGESQDVFRSG